MQQVARVTSHLVELGFFFLAASVLAVGALHLR
jgi:hypothetical protein